MKPSNRLGGTIAGAVLTLGLAGPLPASAQTIDLGRILRGVPLPVDARNAKRGLEQLAAGQECERLKRWISAVPPSPAAMVRGPDTMLPYVDDAVFSAHFGKTYDQLTVDDLRNVQQAQRECHRQGLFTPAEQQLVQQIWNSGMQPRIAQMLVARRAQGNELAGLAAELDALQPVDADYRRIDSLRTRGDALLRSGTAAERQAWATRVDQARERIGVPVERERVAALLASARGAEGLAQLAHAADELLRARLDARQTEALRLQLRERITSLGDEVATAERVAAPQGVPATLDALELSQRWNSDYLRRFAKALPMTPALEALRREQLTRRAGAIQALERPLRAQVEATRSPQEVSAVLSRYLLAEEQAEGVGRALRAAADERRARLETTARNEAVFGRQADAPPAAVAAAPAAPAVPAAPAHPAVARCDALAADPSDPGRTAPGVADEAIVPAAVEACNQALKAAPGVARLSFQQGRALLAAGRQKDAVVAFQQAARNNHPGALAYLGTAHRFGAGGLSKSEARADELQRKAAELGYGSPGAPAVAAAKAGGAAPTGGTLTGRYEQPAIMRAVYFADVAQLPNERMFVIKYLLSQVEALAAECKSFQLSEIRAIQERVARSVMPRTQNEMMEMGAKNLLGTLQMMAEAQRNPQSVVDAGMREQRLEDAPAYAGADIEEFAKHHGGCGTAPMERYTRNLRSYFQSEQASLR